MSRCRCCGKVPAALGALGKIEDVRKEEAVKVAIAVIVGEGRLDARVTHVEAVLMSPLREGAVAVVHEKKVGSVESADIEVGPAVLVDVDHRRTRDTARTVLRAVHARRRRDVHELERSRLPVEGAGSVP